MLVMAGRLMGMTLALAACIAVLACCASTNSVQAIHCDQGCTPDESCCNQSRVLDEHLPDGGAIPIPDGGHSVDVHFPACMHVVKAGQFNGDLADRNGQVVVCDDQY
jgi:hypothetical protein